MKKILTVFKHAGLMVALLCTMAGCSKEETDELNGTWMFRELNYIYYHQGQTINAKEEGYDLSEANNGFRSMYFRFENGKLTGGINGQSGPMGTYTVKGDKITVVDGATTFIMGYKVYGSSLELIWSRAALEMVVGSLPPEFYLFDNVDSIMIFDRVD
jgi:hypothetical protein